MYTIVRIMEVCLVHPPFPLSPPNSSSSFLPSLPLTAAQYVPEDLHIGSEAVIGLGGPSGRDRLGGDPEGDPAIDPQGSASEGPPLEYLSSAGV